MADIKIGALVRLKPGLRDRPQISGRDGVVTAIENDRIRVNVGGNQHLIERHEVQNA
jgi:hypothetical protein